MQYWYWQALKSIGEQDKSRGEKARLHLLQHFFGVQGENKVWTPCTSVVLPKVVIGRKNTRPVKTSKFIQLLQSIKLTFYVKFFLSMSIFTFVFSTVADLGFWKGMRS